MIVYYIYELLFHYNFKIYTDIYKAILTTAQTPVVQLFIQGSDKKHRTLSL